MSLDALLETLRREGEARAEAIVAAGRAEAERIAARDADERRRSLEHDLARRETAIRADAGRTIAEARRDAAREVLTARAAALDRILAAARRRLPELLDDAGVRGALLGGIAPALEFFDGTSPRLSVPERLRGELPRESVAALDGDAGLAESGFRLTAANGRLTVGVSLEDELSRRSAVLRIDLVRELERCG